MGIHMQSELRALEEWVDRLSDLVVAALKESVRCLCERDQEGARLVMQNDRAINDLRFEIEDRCNTVISTQQPVARDTRELISILYIIADLERMGDHAEGIARVAVQLPTDLTFSGHEELRTVFGEMRDRSLAMLEKSIGAFFARDVEQSKEVCKDDDAVDALYREAYSLILSSIGATADVLTKLSWVAHNLERIADRTTNIAERTVFLVTGTMEEIGSSKY